MFTEMAEFGGLVASVSSIQILEAHEIILLGIGGNVEIYDLSSHNCLQRLPIFKNSSHYIHGFKNRTIKPNEPEVITVFGGKSVRTLTINANRNISENVALRYESSDWIMDITIYEGEVFIVTAHNNVKQLDENFAGEKTVASEEKCILYSACFVNDEKYNSSLKRKSESVTHFHLSRRLCF